MTTAAFVPGRLVPLIGRDARDIDPAKLAALAGLPESDVLDFKREPFWDKPSGKTKLATTISAFANRAGGLIIVGIDEDTAGLSPIAGLNSDKEELAIRQSLTDRCAPVPEFDFVDVNGEYLVISVPPSPSRPHAVRHDKKLAFAIRRGNGNDYLTESEVADLYRNRFEEGTQLVALLDERHRQFLDRLPLPEKAWLAVGIEPTRRGQARLSRAGANELGQLVKDLANAFPVWHGDPDSITVRGGFRSYRFSDAYSMNSEPYSLVGELRVDGGGEVAHAWDYRDRRNWIPRPDGSAEAEDETPRPIMIGDEDTVGALINSIGILATWAVETGAGGDAMLVAQFHLPPGDRAILWQYRGTPHDQLRDTTALVTPGDRVEMMVSLEELTAGGSEMMLVVRTLAQDLLSGGFEFVEPYQIDLEGHLVKKYFHRDRIKAIETWAAEHGVVVVE